MTTPKLFPHIETPYGLTAHDPIKVFMVGETYAYSAVVAAALDSEDVREAFLNTLEGPDGHHIICSQPGRDFGDAVARGAIPAILPSPIKVEGHDIVLVDIVTYPLWHCLITGMEPFPDQNSRRLWEINHNILAPYAKLIRACGDVYTFIHLNETPIDNAPTHNLLAFDLGRTNSRQRIHLALEELAEHASNVVYVDEANPVMDDRYVFSRRLSVDMPYPTLTRFDREDLIFDHQLIGSTRA